MITYNETQFREPIASYHKIFGKNDKNLLLSTNKFTRQSQPSLKL